MGGGSGSSGGGGSSGRVDYPDYMKTVHNDWLDQTGSDTITASVTEIMNTALATSPFATAIAYDPTTPLADAWTAVCAFNTLADAMDHESDWLSAMSAALTEFENNVINDTYLYDDMQAYSEIMNDQIENEILPRFKAGYRDANAVQSSAFAIGTALIYAMKNRDVAKYGADLKFKLHLQKTELVARSAEVMLKSQMSRVQFEQAVTHFSVEAKRIHIAAMKEETDQQVAWDESDALWDLKTFKYGAQVLAAISGAVGGTGESQPSTGSSVLGGAMSGAAAGSMISPGWGTAIGAALGAGAALLN